MIPDKNNVILFPNVQEKLQEEAFKALQEKEFAVALDNLNELLQCGVVSYEVHIGKLISLINLRDFIEALEFGEMLLDKEDEHYIDYFDYYLMVLYEMELYKDVMYEIDSYELIQEVPTEFTEKFAMLYELSKQMNQEAFQLVYKKFNRATLSVNYQMQWNYLHQLRDLSIEPPQSLKRLLSNKSIHPVIKTYLFDWFQKHGEHGEVEVEKFNKTKKVDFESYPPWTEHPKYKAIHLIVSDIEQNNPTLYEIIDSLLESYVYVNYPMIEVSSVEDIAEALVHLAKGHLAIDTTSTLSDNLEKNIEMISLSHELYSSIIPE